ncbi:hypothetical protein [Agromyces ramosus]|uniref:Zinc ribbon domain-containing protein n=1 Tax=Agromyces ramosus TaxID=33879 RepID=A0ABU0R6S5_9MICO|nr:hypothetical protein [Agromyces ramosus]MDQ0893437.1 hypothetical protein [Agromyces ramosus]
MAERTCETCGARNDVTARFCAKCDAYLGWDHGHTSLGGDALTGTIPKVVASVPVQGESVPTDAASPGATGDAAEPDVASPGGAGADAGPASEPPDLPEPLDSSKPHEPPNVTVLTPEATITSDAPAQVELSIENPTDIVDGYAIEGIGLPEWLQLAHPDTHLMPGETATVALALGMQPGLMVLAQRHAVEFAVRSKHDPQRQAIVRVVVTVPPRGPRVSLEARPTLIRLEDVNAGVFWLRLDNRAANYPQTVGLSGSDPEGTVQLAFTPQVVEVPPGQVVEAKVAFNAPAPAPGQQLNRQLTITAVNDEGPITATVSLVQHTTALPVDEPISVLVQPSTFSLVDARDADFEVLVDNRGGHSGVTVTLTGRDPESRLAFAFTPVTFTAFPGKVTRALGRVRGVPPPRGSSDTFPFTVVASDGTTDVEASALLEMTSTPASITVAELRAEPRNLNVGTRRDGTYAVQVDNRRGTEQLHVWLSASSDDGQVRAQFSPQELIVAPGGVGRSQLSVNSPHPPANQVSVHRLEITATDGAHTVTTNAELMQSAPNRRRPTSRWLVILGTLFAIIGALSPWFDGFSPLLPLGDWIMILVSSPASFAEIEWVEPPLRLLLVLTALAMAFGLNGKAGGLTRRSALLLVLLTAGFLVYLSLRFGMPPLSFGLPLIWLGAVLGYIGGVLLRPPR